MYSIKTFLFKIFFKIRVIKCFINVICIWHALSRSKSVADFSTSYYTRKASKKQFKASVESNLNGRNVFLVFFHK